MNAPMPAYRLLIRPLIATTALLLVPLVAMQFTREVQWTPFDFVFAAALILALAVPLEFVIQRTRGAYRLAAAVALLTTFLMTWVNAAVGITDSEADAFYLLVVLVGVLGAAFVRARPAGLAWVVTALAALLVLIGLGALLSGITPPHNTPPRLMALTAFFAVPLLFAAFLFRQAVRGSHGI